MPNRKSEHGLFVEYGLFRAGAFGWIGIIGLDSPFLAVSGHLSPLHLALLLS